MNFFDNVTNIVRDDMTETITRGSVIKTIAKRQPLRAVFRDSSFVNSPSKIKVGEVFKLLAPEYQSESNLRGRFQNE